MKEFEMLILDRPVDKYKKVFDDGMRENVLNIYICIRKTGALDTF